jgi:hypothetical protein
MLMKKCKKTKRVRIGTHATQVARDHQPPRRSTWINNATDNTPMGILTCLRCGKVSSNNTVKNERRKWGWNAKTVCRMMAMGGDSRWSRRMLEWFGWFNPETDWSYLKKNTLFSLSFTNPPFLICATREIVGGDPGFAGCNTTVGGTGDRRSTYPRIPVMSKSYVSALRGKWNRALWELIVFY